MAIPHYTFGRSEGGPSFGRSTGGFAFRPPQGTDAAVAGWPTAETVGPGEQGGNTAGASTSGVVTLGGSTGGSTSKYTPGRSTDRSTCKASEATSLKRRGADRLQSSTETARPGAIHEAAAAASAPGAGMGVPFVGRSSCEPTGCFKFGAPYGAATPERDASPPESQTAEEMETGGHQDQLAGAGIPALERPSGGPTGGFVFGRWANGFTFRAPRVTGSTRAWMAWSRRLQKRWRPTIEREEDAATLNASGFAGQPFAAEVGAAQRWQEDDLFTFIQHNVFAECLRGETFRNRARALCQ